MNVSSGDEDSVSLGESVAILLSDCTQSISYIKSTQWIATNYTVLIYFAIFSMKFEGKIDLNFEFLSGILFSFWAIFQSFSIRSLHEKRTRMKKLRNLLHHKAMESIKDVDYEDKIFRDYFIIFIPHLCIVLFSFWAVSLIKGEQ